MVGAGMLGRQQQEYEIDRLSVHRIEVDGSRKPGENSMHPAQSLDLSVRNGNALAETGRAEFFALEKRFEDAPLLEPRDLGSSMRKLMKELLLAWRPEVRDNRAGIDNVGKMHLRFSPL